MLFGLEGKGYHTLLSVEFTNILTLKRLKERGISSTGKIGNYLKLLPK